MLMKNVSGGDQGGKRRMETHRSCHANTEDDDRLLLALGGRGIGAGRPSFGRGSGGHIIVMTGERLCK